MYAIKQTSEFSEWLGSLRDKRGASRIVMRLERAAAGNLGDTKPVGEGVSEMRVDHGPGYRVYFIRRGDTVVVLLCGGDKSSQQRDIADAKRLAREWRE
jgi:putative addiction module killer protein